MERERLSPSDVFQRLGGVVEGESWGTFLKVTLGTWMMVWLFAALHNQYLIRIAPEHFTVWHYKIPFTQDYTLLGIAYAFGASASPGLVLGMCLYVAGRLGPWPKVPVRRLLLGTAWVWLAMELCAIPLGWWVWRTGRGIYPEWVYPDDSRGLLTTQTIQVTAYLLGAGFALVLIGVTWGRRVGKGKVLAG